MIDIYAGDMLVRLPGLADDSIDAVVTDPPYHLTSTVARFGGKGAAPAKFGSDGAFARASAGFMGQQWDGGDIAFRPETWVEVLRVMKPGAYLAAFGGTRTFHRMAVAIEDAGFELRDTLCWLYGVGFPKSHDVAKNIDKAARGVPHGGSDPTSPNHGKYKGGCSEDNPDGRGFGAGPGSFMAESGQVVDRPLVPEAAEWQGFGTSLKPGWEPIILARKPLIGTVVENVLAYRTGGININACRIEAPDGVPKFKYCGGSAKNTYGDGLNGSNRTGDIDTHTGRFPANVLHDGSDEVMEAFAAFGGKTGGHHPKTRGRGNISTSGHAGQDGLEERHSDTGTAARFFYSAKASKADRAGSKHPTVKPVALMQWLCKLICPPSGMILDPFAGSGTTGAAVHLEGFDAVLIEQSEQYVADICRRLPDARYHPDMSAFW